MRRGGTWADLGPSGHCVAVDKAEGGKRPDRKWWLQARGGSWRNQQGGQSGLNKYSEGLHGDCGGHRSECVCMLRGVGWDTTIVDQWFNKLGC